MTTLARGRSDKERILPGGGPTPPPGPSGKLGDERRPGEVLCPEAGAGARVVVLAQAFARDGADHATSEALGRLLVAEAAQAEPEQPGRVDPGRHAPVAAHGTAAA